MADEGPSNYVELNESLADIDLVKLTRKIPTFEFGILRTLHAKSDYSRVITHDPSHRVIFRDKILNMISFLVIYV